MYHEFSPKPSSALSQEFQHHSSWAEYSLFDSMSPLVFPKKVGGWVRYGVWPFRMNVYQGDVCPRFILTKSVLPQVYIWNRLSDDMVLPHGWRLRNHPSKLCSLYGVLEVQDDLYYEKWSKSARYDRKVWNSLSHNYVIESVSPEVFFLHYEKSATAKNAGLLTVKALKHDSLTRYVSGKVRVVYLLAYSKSSHDMVAGMVYESSTLSANTYYSIGFLKSYSYKEPVMNGLITEWIERERALGAIWFNFGLFWQEGLDSSWKGFSQFKAKFGVDYYKMPPSLKKVVWPFSSKK